MRMTELENKILEAQEAYYNGQPIMNDIEFDELWDKLKKEQPDSEILQNVGQDHTDGFAKAEHIIVMGSQNKANTSAEMDKWFKTIKSDSVTWSYKMDGISIEMAYNKGKFIRATTRGDGKVGDDVTKNVIKMGGVIKQLKDDFTGAVRGEILLSRENKEKFFSEYANCRNAASGVCKRLDGSGCEHLNVVVYDAQYSDGRIFGTQYNLMKWLEKHGFEVADWGLTNTFDGEFAKDKVDEIFTKFDSLKYDIDGLVWKQNDIDQLDLKNMRPKTQIALKPERTYGKSVLRDIDWRLSNGTFTPVAVFDPIVAKMGLIIPKVVKDITTGKFAEGYAF